jgi:hypothetical protein
MDSPIRLGTAHEVRLLAEHRLEGCVGDSRRWMVMDRAGGLMYTWEYSSKESTPVIQSRRKDTQDGPVYATLKVGKASCPCKFLKVVSQWLHPNRPFN